jgi:hypothetical protein
MVDQKVDERWQKFQEEYDEVLNKMKKQVVSLIKPGALGLGRASA